MTHVALENSGHRWLGSRTFRGSGTDVGKRKLRSLQPSQLLLCVGHDAVFCVTFLTTVASGDHQLSG